MEASDPLSARRLDEFVQAVTSGAVETARALLARDPSLVSAPLPVSPLALASGTGEREMVRLLLEAGADVRSDGPPALRHAARQNRVELCELLLRWGVDANAPVPGYGPVLRAACEGHALEAVRLLLAHGADAIGTVAGARSFLGTNLGAAVGSEVRSGRLHAIVEALISAGMEGGETPVMAIHRGRLDLLEQHLDRNPFLLHARFPELDYGPDTSIPFPGGTLLHLCAEFNEVEAARLLLERGAEVNARAEVGEAGCGGHTPVFHAVTSWESFCFPMLELLVEHGADLTIRATLNLLGKPLSLTPLGLALQYGNSSFPREVAFLRRHGAGE